MTEILEWNETNKVAITDILWDKLQTGFFCEDEKAEGFLEKKVNPGNFDTCAAVKWEQRPGSINWMMDLYAQAMGQAPKAKAGKTKPIKGLDIILEKLISWRVQESRSTGKDSWPTLHFDACTEMDLDGDLVIGLGRDSDKGASLNGPGEFKSRPWYGYIKRMDDGAILWFPRPDTPESVIRFVERLAADFEGLISEYGRKSGNCGGCGRAIHTPMSLDIGFGPVCAGRLGLHYPSQSEIDKREQKVDLKDELNDDLPDFF